MKKVSKSYVEFLFPGSFLSESSIKEVDNIGADVQIPDGAFAYLYFQRDYVVDEAEGKTYDGDVHDRTGRIYIDGEVYDETRLAAEHGKDSTLYHNVIGNGYTHAVKTRRGNWQPLMDGDKVTKSGEVIFG